MAFLVPPGGPAGFRQMTPASRSALFPRGGNGGSRKRRRKTKAARPTKRRKSKGGRKLKFGSPAWRKKYMK